MAVVFVYRWNYALSGLNPWSYHAVNVILHAAVSALFAWLCLNCLGLSKLSSLLTASLFAIHPIHTEAVTSLNIFTLFLPFFCVYSLWLDFNFPSFHVSPRDGLFWSSGICTKSRKMGSRVNRLNSLAVSLYKRAGISKMSTWAHQSLLNSSANRKPKWWKLERNRSYLSGFDGRVAVWILLWLIVKENVAEN